MSESKAARRILGLAAAGLILGALAACGQDDTVYPRDAERGPGGTYEPKESVFGGDGLTLFDTSGDGPLEGAANDGSGGGIGVNSFLWRASLDTISFMPLASADPFGGVIITDWYSPPEADNERFKVNVYILGRDLRADGIRAAVFRQQLSGGVGWTDARVEDQTVVDLENAILTRARQLRIAGIQ